MSDIFPIRENKYNASHDISVHIKVNSAAVQKNLNFRAIHQLCYLSIGTAGLALPSCIKIGNRQNLAFK